MTKDCKEKISWLMMHGTTLDNEISLKLNDEKKYQFRTIAELGQQLNIAISTVSRYVKKLGYLYFKDFMYEYNEKNYENVKGSEVSLGALTSKASGRTNDDCALECNVSQIGQKLKGKIHVISSQRSKAIAKLIIERLKDANIESAYFNENTEEFEQWIKNINPQDSVILVTVSGHSLRIQKTLEIFEKMAHKPFGLIITAAKNLKVPENVSVITPNILHSKYHLNEWVEYNIVQLKIINIVTILLNSAFLYRSQVN